MSDITPIGRSSVPALGGQSRAHTSSAEASVSRPSDQVELSDRARLLSQLSRIPDVRQGLIDRVQAEIDQGSYETPDKIDAAIDALAEDVL